MLFKIISVGTKIPTWVSNAFQEYKSRFPKNINIELIEIPIAKRSKGNDVAKLIALEGKKILSHIKNSDLNVALEVKGNQWTTHELAKNLQNWEIEYRVVNFIIGGPDGIDNNCLALAQYKWSLSKLTFPHNLVRILLIEQLYRANSILNNHPYHRE